MPGSPDYESSTLTTFLAARDPSPYDNASFAGVLAEYTRLRGQIVMLKARQTVGASVTSEIAEYRHRHCLANLEWLSLVRDLAHAQAQAEYEASGELNSTANAIATATQTAAASRYGPAVRVADINTWLPAAVLAETSDNW